jgi:hypothetical protein
MSLDFNQPKPDISDIEKAPVPEREVIYAHIPHAGADGKVHLVREPLYTAVGFGYERVDRMLNPWRGR